MITEAVTIDGTTQLDGHVELRPSPETSAFDALQILGDGTTVRGLIIHGFVGSGVFIHSSSNLIEGNFIGTDIAGAAPRPGRVPDEV